MNYGTIPNRRVSNLLDKRVRSHTDRIGRRRLGKLQGSIAAHVQPYVPQKVCRTAHSGRAGIAYISSPDLSS